MQLSRALRLPPQPADNPQHGGCIAFVGAGGKTTAIFQLARELLHPSSFTQSVHPSVIVTATSHLGAWQISLADHHIIAESPEEIGELPEGVTLITGLVEGDRTRPVNSSVLFWLRETTKRDNLSLLIEADGARCHPLKAPAAHEPPIPDFVDTVIVVAGLSGLDKPVTDEFVFRTERFRKISKSASPVMTAEMLTRVLIHPDGGLKNIPPHARRIALLNQAETPELQAIGGKMSKILLNEFGSVVVGSLQPSDLQPANFQTFEPVAGIILAAGQSSRFGQPKQLLDWKGKPFVRQVAETALSAGLWPVIVVTGANAEQVEQTVNGLDVTIVRNENWKSGQSTSIIAGIQALPKNTGASLFMLADQPQIPAEVVRAIGEAHAQNLPAILAPLVLGEKRANPVLFDRAAFPDLLTLTGDIGGRAIFKKHRVEYLPWHDDILLMDVDTPEDYGRLKGL
jgi:molybdenum cofactor cytidylyltransferase